MATNREFAHGGQLTVVAADCTAPNDPIESGDPLLYGVGVIPGVALGDEDGDGNVVVQFDTDNPVYRFAVVGADGSGNAAIDPGDLVYYDGGALNADDANGTAFGTALDAVASGATTTIRVRLGA